jgi:predicted membrane chloride channel (bestrophin family)
MLSRGLHQVHTLLVRGGELIVALAATWAVGASLYIFSSPISVHGVTDVMLRDSSTVVTAFTREQSWYEAQGLWGILWLVFFSGLYLLAAWVAWSGNHIALAIMSVTAVALSIVTGFSIGGAYLPAALGLFIGPLMFLSSKLMRAQC